MSRGENGTCWTICPVVASRWSTPPTTATAWATQTAFGPSGKIGERPTSEIDPRLELLDLPARVRQSHQMVPALGQRPDASLPGGEDVGVVGQVDRHRHDLAGRGSQTRHCRPRAPRWRPPRRARPRRPTAAAARPTRRIVRRRVRPRRRRPEPTGAASPTPTLRSESRAFPPSAAATAARPRSPAERKRLPGSLLNARATMPSNALGAPSTARPRRRLVEVCRERLELGLHGKRTSARQALIEDGAERVESARASTAPADLLRRDIRRSCRPTGRSWSARRPWPRRGSGRSRSGRRARRLPPRHEDVGRLDVTVDEPGAWAASRASPTGRRSPPPARWSAPSRAIAADRSLDEAHREEQVSALLAGGGHGNTFGCSIAAASRRLAAKRSRKRSVGERGQDHFSARADERQIAPGRQPPSRRARRRRGRGTRRSRLRRPGRAAAVRHR